MSCPKLPLCIRCQSLLEKSFIFYLFLDLIIPLHQTLVLGHCQRPYCVENTGSLPNSEVKHRKARIVLGWVTAREVLRVLLAFLSIHKFCYKYVACLYVNIFLIKTFRSSFYFELILHSILSNLSIKTYPNFNALLRIRFCSPYYIT